MYVSTAPYVLHPWRRLILVRVVRPDRLSALLTVHHLSIYYQTNRLVISLSRNSTLETPVPGNAPVPLHFIGRLILQITYHAVYTVGSAAFIHLQYSVYETVTRYYFPADRHAIWCTDHVRYIYPCFRAREAGCKDQKR